MKIEVPPALKGKTSEWRDLESWLRQLKHKTEAININGQSLSLDPLPSLSGGSDDREWTSLSLWLSVLHSQIGKPFAHAFPTVTKTTTATLRVEEIGIVLVNSTGGAFSITLPPAAKMGAGGWFRFCKVDAAANAVTLDGSGSELINGVATNTQLDAQYDFMEIVSNGTGWLITNIRSTM